MAINIYNPLSASGAAAAAAAQQKPASAGVVVASANGGAQPAQIAQHIGALVLAESHFNLVTASPNHQFTPQEKKQIIDHIAVFNNSDAFKNKPDTARKLHAAAQEYKEKISKIYIQLSGEHAIWFSDIIRSLDVSIKKLEAASRNSPALANSLRSLDKSKAAAIKAAASAEKYRLKVATKLKQSFKQARKAEKNAEDSVKSRIEYLEKLNAEKSHAEELALKAMRLLQAQKEAAEQQAREAAEKLAAQQTILNQATESLKHLTAQLHKIESDTRTQVQKIDHEISQTQSLKDIEIAQLDATRKMKAELLAYHPDLADLPASPSPKPDDISTDNNAHNNPAAGILPQSAPECSIQ